MSVSTRRQRRSRIRAKISGTGVRPRLSVFRSIKYIYGQIIDDEKGATLVSYSDHDKKILSDKEKLSDMSKVERARLVGEKLASLAKKKKIKRIVFDRSGYRYHGRVKALAEGAREGGLVF